MTEVPVQHGSPWIKAPAPAGGAGPDGGLWDEVGTTEVLFLNAWTEPTSVSAPFQIIREELSHCSQIVTARVLETMLSPAELPAYTDAIRYARRSPVSLGMLAIATCLEANGISACCLSLEEARAAGPDGPGWLAAAVTTALQRTGCRVVGVGGTTSEAGRVEALCREIRAQAPALPIVYGGPHATFRPGDLLRKGLVDIVVQGEGELPMLEIVRRLRAGAPLAGIPSTAVLEGDAVLETPRGAFPALEDLPVPRYDLLNPWARSQGILYAMYSRACPYSCRYCSETRLFGSRLRHYDPAPFVDSLEYIHHQLNWRFIHLADSTFGMPRRALDALLDELERRDTRFLFSVNVRPDMHRYADAALIARMRRLGFIEFLIGAESGSDTILQAMGRRHTTEDLVRTLRLLKDAKVPFVSTYWMVGLPFDTLDTVTQTARFVKGLLEEGLVFYASSKPFIPLPGTPVFEDPARWGIRIVSQDWSLYERYGQPLPHEHANFSAEEIEAATVMMQSVQAAVFQRRAGSRRYADIADLRSRIDRSYERAVYL